MLAQFKKTLCLFVVLISLIFLSGCNSDSEQINAAKVGQSLTAKATLAPANTIIFNSSNRRLAHVGANTTQIQIKIPNISGAPTFSSFEMGAVGGNSKDIFDNQSPVCVESGSNSCAFKLYTLSLNKPLTENAQYVINGWFSGSDIITIPYYFDTQPRYKIFDSSPSNDQTYMGNGTTGVGGFDKICAASIHEKINESFIGKNTNTIYKAMIGSWEGTSGTGVPRSICANINPVWYDFESTGQCGGNYSKNWIFQRNSNYYNIYHTPIVIPYKPTTFIESSDSYGLLHSFTKYGEIDVSEQVWHKPISIGGEARAWSGFNNYWVVLTGESTDTMKNGDLTCNGWTATNIDGSIGHHDKTTGSALKEIRTKTNHNPFTFIDQVSCKTKMQVACVEQPKIALVQPANPNNASVNTPIEIQFPDQIDFSTVSIESGNFSVTDENNVPVDGTITEVPNVDGTTTAPNNTNLIFIPTQPLQINSTYNVVINGESVTTLLDAVGNSVPSTTFTFTVTNSINVRNSTVGQLIMPVLPIDVPTNTPIIVQLDPWVNYSNAQVTIEENSSESSVNKLTRQAANNNPAASASMTLLGSYQLENVFTISVFDANQQPTTLQNSSLEQITISGLSDWNGYPIKNQTFSFKTQEAKEMTVLSAIDNSVNLQILNPNITSFQNARIIYCTNNESASQSRKLVNTDLLLDSGITPKFCPDGQEKTVVSVATNTLSIQQSSNDASNYTLTPTNGANIVGRAIISCLFESSNGYGVVQNQVTNVANSSSLIGPVSLVWPTTNTTFASINPTLRASFTESPVIAAIRNLINQSPQQVVAYASVSSSKPIPVYARQVDTNPMEFMLQIDGQLPLNSNITISFVSTILKASSNSSALTLSYTTESQLNMYLLNGGLDKQNSNIDSSSTIFIGGDGLRYAYQDLLNKLVVECYDTSTNKWSKLNNIEFLPISAQDGILSSDYFNAISVTPRYNTLFPQGQCRVRSVMPLFAVNLLQQVNVNVPFTVATPLRLAISPLYHPLFAPLLPSFLLEATSERLNNMIDYNTLSSDSLILVDVTTNQTVGNGTNLQISPSPYGGINVSVTGTPLQLNHNYSLQNVSVQDLMGNLLTLNAPITTLSSSVVLMSAISTSSTVAMYTNLPVNTNTVINSSSISITNSNDGSTVPISSITLSNDLSNTGLIYINLSTSLISGNNYEMQTTSSSNMGYTTGESITFDMLFTE